MLTTCPHCGESYTIDLAGVIPLTARQHELLRQLADLHHWRRGAVPTVVLADLMGFTPRYIRRYLHELEQLGFVCRVGQRGGWTIPVERKMYLYQSGLLAA